MNMKKRMPISKTEKSAPLKRPPTLKRLEKRIDRLKTELEVNALESLYSWLDPNGFGGSDALERMWRQKGVTGSGEVGWVPLNLVSDRKEGRKWPIWSTEVELNGIRAQSRLCYEDNPYGTGLVNSLVNYAIGKGFSYKFQLKMPNDPVAAMNYKRQLTEQGLMESYKELVDRVQEWLDDFLQRNNWTTSQQADEDCTKITGTREVEAAIRLFVDGEAIFRLYPLAGANRGRCVVRFIEPVRVTNPAGGRYEDGWSFGVKTAVHELEDGTTIADEETIVEINVVNQDQVEIEDNPASGVPVSAEEIVWLAPRTEAACVKRGTPLLAFGLKDSLDRAYQIQANASKSAAWRAATVEIWKHLQGTKAGVQSIAQGNGTVSQDSSGQQRITQKLQAPSIRDIGPGKEPVTPTAVGYSEYMDVAQGDLRQAGAPTMTPEFMISGDASNNNYASIKEAGAPFFVNNTITQEHFKRAFSAVIRKALKIAVKAKLLPKEVMKILELIVESPKDDTRSPGERAQEDAQLIDKKIKSPQTCQAERGLDSEQEFQNFEEFEGRFGPNGQGGQTPGSDGMAGLMDGGGGASGASDAAGGSDDDAEQAAALGNDNQGPPAPVLEAIDGKEKVAEQETEKEDPQIAAVRQSIAKMKTGGSPDEGKNLMMTLAKMTTEQLTKIRDEHKLTADGDLKKRLMDRLISKPDDAPKSKRQPLVSKKPETVPPGDIAVHAVDRATKGEKMNGAELKSLQAHMYKINPDDVRKLAERMQFPNARNMSRTKAMESILNHLSPLEA